MATLGALRVRGADADAASTANSVEAEIMRRALHDLSAFEPIYRAQHGRVFGFCYRRLGDRDDAADATSQTFTKAISALSTYRGGSVAGWLIVIASNVMADSSRRKRPQTSLDAAVELADARTGPLESAIETEQLAILRAALGRLTKKQRNVVELRLAGLTGNEVAEALGLSLSAVKSNQFRAYTRLRDLLTDIDAFGGGR